MNEEQECKCTTKHIPKPTSYIQTEGVILCPTSACNLALLLVEWSKHGGEPPGSVTKYYSAYIRKLAKEKHEPKDNKV